MSEFILSAAATMREQILRDHGEIQAQTTFALAWMDDNQLITAHVGDSRIYRMDSTRVIWRTPDHTPVQELFEQGEITEENFAEHPLQNRLLRAVNIFETPEADIYIHERLNDQETLLLCTDGFWAYLKPAEVLDVAKSHDIKKIIDENIIKILTKYGEQADNISLQVIRRHP
jgi:serine/threonine protein phosphatase PrpC